MVTRKFIFFAAVAALLLSCTKEEKDRTGAVTYAFTAHMAQNVNVPKAVMDDKGESSWNAGDEIAVWDERSGEFKTFTNNGAGGRSATFTFTGEPGVEYEFSRAVSPASAVKEKNNFDSPLTLPGEYGLEDVSAASLIPLIATVENDALYFKHLGAVVRFRIEGIPSAAASLVLSSSSVSLSGDFPLSNRPIDDGLPHAGCEDMNVKSASSDVPDFEIQARDGSRCVSIDISGRSTNSLTVYLPLPVGVYPYTLTLKDSGNEVLWSKSTAMRKEIRRATLYRMVGVGALFSGGSGSASNPYRLSSAADLLAFQSLLESQAEYRSMHYRLTADIDMGGVANFSPVGTDTDNMFTGVFDGAGHTISNLTVTRGSNAGFFGCLGGTVKNLRFENAAVSATSGSCAAVVAAVVDGVSPHIEGCRADAGCSVQAGGNSAGGIAGFMRTGVINSCASHASVTAGSYCAGGIVGYIQCSSVSHNALVINCIYSPVYRDGFLSGAVLQATNANAFVGGIAGSASCSEGRGIIKIVNCFAYPLEMRVAQSAGTVVQRIGGIVGYAGSGGVDGAMTVRNCLSPVTYSNVIVGGTRLNAKTYGASPQTASVIGAIPYSGVILDRLFSTNTWNKCYFLANGVSVTESNINARLGDTNLRGLGTATVGATEYTKEIGGLAAALNAGVADWNTSAAAVALEWAYDPTFGYPLPEGVDAPGTATRKVSLMGDSISTYQGFMFSDNSYTMNKWYPDSGNTYTGQILNEQETWWWKLIYGKMHGARLEASNAFSGATVCYLEGRSEQQVTTNCFQRRAYLYDFGEPDVLFYYGGRNDFGSFGSSSDVNLGSYADDALAAAWSGAAGEFFDNFSQGTVGILRDFHAHYPGAKVLIIMHDQMSDGYADAAQAIASFLAARGLDIRYVNLHKAGTKNATNTDIGITKEGGTHPNAAGAANIANYVWARVGTWLDE